MMKKKVKKIPKYNAGGSVLDTLLKNNPLSGNTVGSTNNNSTNNFSKFSDWKGTSANPWKDMNATQKMGAVTDAVGAIGQGLSVATSGQDVNVGTALSTAAGMAGAGMTIGGPIGAGIGAAAGLVMGTAGRKAGYDENSASTSFKDIYDPGSGWLGAISNKKAAKIGANMIQNNNIAKIQSEGIKADYHNNPNVVVLPNVLVAEGGIVPGEHYASRGEVEVAADGTNAVRYKWDPKGKDTYHVMFNPDGTPTVGNMIFTDEGVRRPNGEKYSDAAEKIIKSTKEGSKLRQISLRKLVNEMEEQKMNKGILKIKKGIPAHEGGLNPYSYNKNLEEFIYWDKDKNEYKKEYLDWVSNLTEQDVRDIEAGKYGDMTEYFSKNKGKKLDVATAQKLMTDKKYGNWHKIGQAIVNNKIKTSVPPTVIDSYSLPIKGGTISEKAFNFTDSGKPLITHRIPYIDKNLKKLANPSEADGIIAAYKAQNKGKGTSDWLNTLSDYAPLAAALLGDYDYHKEEAIISPAKYIPTGVSIDPIRRAADESYAMARYNQANISPNTGAGMAYGLQAASNRAKQLSDAYQWQQEQQNKLIAQNVGIYNDWANRYDTSRYKAIENTMANEAAARQMRDQAIKDAYEFQTGRRNDRWKLSMMEPLMKYAVDENIYKKFKI